MSLAARKARTRRVMMNKCCQGLMKLNVLLTANMGIRAGLMIQSVYDAHN